MQSNAFHSSWQRWAGPALSGHCSGNSIDQKPFPVGSLDAQCFGGIYRIVKLKLEGTFIGHLVQQSAQNRSDQMRLLRSMFS